MSTVPALQAVDVRKYYPVRSGPLQRSLVRALDGVSFELAAGATLGVVGESGCGKSTLARQLVGMETPDSGRVVVGGAAMRGAGPELRRSVRLVFQDPFGSLNPRRRIDHQIEEPLRNFTTLDAGQRRRRAGEWLERVGLQASHGRRFPHMFSGGQRQRIAIARALAVGPAVLVADEPVAALDVSVQAQILNLLLDLQADLGLACVFISHDIAVVRHVADQVLVLYCGRMMELGPAREVIDRPAHPYTRALISSVPRIGVPAGQGTVLPGEPASPLAPPPGCVFHRRCPLAEPRCRSEVPAARQIGARLVACHLARPADAQ